MPRRQLIEAVRTVAEGDALLAPAITRRLVEEFVRRPPPAAGTPPPLERLTGRELDVLRLIARGLSNAEIAGRLTSGRTPSRPTSPTSWPSCTCATGPSWS